MMTPETVDLLNRLDEALAKHDRTAEELWIVLTALRGPDAGDVQIKHDTTAVLRTAAFPKTQASCFPDAVFARPGVPYDPSGLVGRVSSIDNDTYSHFGGHTIRAARVLQERLP